MRLVDPRPDLGGNAIPLAPRRDLSDRRVLLFDNGKLDPRLGHFVAVFDVIESALRRRFPSAVIERRSDDLLRRPTGELEAVATEIAARADAVVIALCDYGVCQPTAMVAASLERSGVATSLICQGDGAALMATIAAQLIPGLPIAELRDDAVAAWWTASYREIADETSLVTDDVLEGLVGRIDVLRARSSRYRGGAVLRPDPAGIDAADDLDFTRAMREAGLGDGLPLVAPTVERVDAMLERRDPSSVVWPVVMPRASPLTAKDVAVISVMAGCDPLWFPVVLAAYRAMALPEFRLAQAAITTNPSGTLVIVSGPTSDALGLRSGAGSLGPGHHANATVGRAVALAYAFGFGARIGVSDLTMQGSPAKYSYCCAENLAASPWQGMHADLVGEKATSVTVLKCEGPRSVADNTSMDAISLLRTIAAATVNAANVNVRNPYAETVVFLNPAHARIVHAAGMTKRAFQESLFEHARIDRAVVDATGGRLARRPEWMDGLDRIPIVERAQDFIVVVTGSPGLHSAVAPPWGTARSCTATIDT